MACRTRGGVETVTADVRGLSNVEAVIAHRGRHIRPSRRPHQQRGRAGTERAHSQSDDRRLGTQFAGERHGFGQRHPGRGAGDARTEVGVDHPHCFGRRNDRVVAFHAVLRDQGGRHPACEGRGSRVPPRWHPRELRLPGDVSFRHPPRTCLRKQSTRSRPSIRSVSAMPTADQRVLHTAGDAARWTTGATIVVDGGYTSASVIPSIHQ